MTASAIRRASRTGLVFSVGLVFMFLIGFTTALAELIDNLLRRPGAEGESVPLLGFAILLALLGLWCGARASQKEPLGRVARASLMAGLSAGIPSAAVGCLFGILLAAGVDVRTYFISLSPDTIRLFQFYLAPLPGSLVLLLTLMIATLLGGVLTRLLGSRARVCVQRTTMALQSQSPRARQAWQTPAVRYGVWGLLAASLIILPRSWGPYWNYVLGTVGIYVLLGLGLNIITGWAGQLVIGYVAFFAIGAYSFALLTAPQPLHLQWNFWIALLTGVIAAAIAGLLIGLPILNLRGDYLAIVTLGLAEIVRILLNSDMLTDVTGGPKGIRDIGGPTLLGRPFDSDVDFMYLILIAVLVVTFLALRLQNGRTGRGWVAIREDETVARATGINAYASKLLALAISAGIAGLAGAIFASRSQFTGPGDHSLLVAINVICLVIVGGIGSIPGVFLGALVLKGLPEVLREVDNYRMLVFGALLVVMMNIRPEGLWPAKRPKLDRSAEADAEPTPASAVELEAR